VAVLMAVGSNRHATDRKSVYGTRVDLPIRDSVPPTWCGEAQETISEEIVRVMTNSIETPNAKINLSL
jgi:hypothetical protein